MKYLKKLTIVAVWAVTVLMGLMLQTSCSKNESNRFVFHSSDEAISMCRQTLKEFQGVKEADINKLTKVVSTWLELQDSVYNYLSNDTTIQVNSHVVTDYYSISDSIRNEIIRIAQTKKRSLRDVTYLKINTAKDKEKTRESQDFKTACKMFFDMDKASTYMDANSTVKAYLTLLDSTKTFTKEGDVLVFIKEEDRCFRSLMNHLTEVDQEVLVSITNKTAHLFDDLYKRVSTVDNNPVSERVMLYLTMRFNRRILQNAEACKKDIKDKKTLNSQQLDNYRWMLIQPFMSIDNYSMATLTDEQQQQFLKLAEKLPSLIAYLDGTTDVPGDLKKTTEVLSEFFLSSYLKSSL